MDEVSVGVFEGGDPAAPGLPLRGAHKLDSFFCQAMVFAVDAVHAEVNHDPVGILSGAFDGCVQSKAQSHIAEAESDEISVVGV